MVETIIKILIILMTVYYINSTSLDIYEIISERDPNCYQKVIAFREFYFKVPEEMRAMLRKNFYLQFKSRYPWVQPYKIENLVSMYCNVNFTPTEVCQYSREILKPFQLNFVKDT